MKKETKIMGILNVTPDSFSDGGRFEGGNLLEVLGRMIEDGVDLVDIGGESTGPGSSDVSLEEELRRVVPAVAAVREAFPELVISVDTWKSEVAEAALEAGADMINDVTAGRGDGRIFEVVARRGAPIVLMYSKDGTPRTTRNVVRYDDVMRTVKDFLRERIEVAKAFGVKEIIVDPGMGAFVSGDAAPSFELLERIEELDELGCPVLVGTSRKSFLCEGTPSSDERLLATLATSVWLKGKVDFLRVHDVLENGTAC